MGGVALDFSKAQPLPQPSSGVELDFTKAQPVAANASTQPTPSVTRAVDPAAAPTSQPAQSSAPGIIGTIADAGKNYGSGFMKEGERTLGGVLKILGDTLGPQPGQAAPTSAIGKVVAAPADYVASHLKRGADWLNSNTDEHGFWEHAGGFGENIAELLTPEALASLAKPAQAAKAVEGAKALESGAETMKALPGAAEKLADAGKVATLLDRYPKIKTLLGLGMAAAARGSAETGIQTFFKTGGDEQQTLNAAETGAMVGGVAAPLTDLASSAIAKHLPTTRTVEGVDIPVTPEPKPTASQQAGAEAYTQTARATAAPHMNDIGMSPAQVKTSLDTVHDFTGVADRLTDANARAYDFLDERTGGAFRRLNNQVQAASKAAFDGGDEAVSRYQDLKDKMTNLLDKVGGGQLTPAWMQKVKASWTQSYILQDAGRLLDRSMDGLPGRSGVSQEQRGINGNELEKGLQRLVEMHGYDTVAKAMGPGRLENLQAIANATKTNAGRRLLNQAVHSVAGYIGIASGAALGHAVGGGEVGATIGAAMGYGAAHATREAVGRTMDAIRANPKVGRALLYMLEKGSSPDVYGPVISSMITQENAPNAKPQQ